MQKHNNFIKTGNLLQYLFLYERFAKPFISICGDVSIFRNASKRVATLTYCDIGSLIYDLLNCTWVHIIPLAQFPALPSMNKAILFFQNHPINSLTNRKWGCNCRPFIRQNYGYFVLQNNLKILLAHGMLNLDADMLCNIMYIYNIFRILYIQNYL